MELQAVNPFVAGTTGKVAMTTSCHDWAIAGILVGISWLVEYSGMVRTAPCQPLAIDFVNIC